MFIKTTTTTKTKKTTKKELNGIEDCSCYWWQKVGVLSFSRNIPIYLLQDLSRDKVISPKSDSNSNFL